MIAQEREFLKARANLDRLIEIVQQAGKEHTRVDEVERSIFTELLSTGFHLISAFVAAAGDGDMGETLKIPVAGDGPPPDGGRAPATRTLRRLEKPHTRSFVSIFGKLELTRYVYGTREGQKIEAIPLDAQLGLPAGGDAGPGAIRASGRSHESTDGRIRPGLSDQSTAAASGRRRGIGGIYGGWEGGAHAASSRPETSSRTATDEGTKGQQEEDVLCGGGLYDRPIHSDRDRRNRRVEAENEGQGPARATAQARRGGNDRSH